MNHSCVSQTQGLGEPDNYKLVLHTMTLVALPINCYGTFCILFRTSDKMKAVKWLMLRLHLLSAFLDVFFGFISVPFLFLPVMAGYPLGAWEAPLLEFYVINLVLGGVGVSILSLFENRYFVLFGTSSSWAKYRRPYLICNWLFASLFFIPSVLAVPDQQEAFLKVAKTLPCIPEQSIQRKRLFVLTLNNTLTLVCLLGFATLLSAEIAAFSFILFWKILIREKTTSVVSRATTRLQKKFAVAMFLQTILPFAVLCLPCLYELVAVQLCYYNQAMNNLVFCFFAAHGVCSTIIMLCVHQPYREATLKPLKFIFKRPTGAMKRARVEMTSNSFVRLPKIRGTNAVLAPIKY